MLIPLNRLRIHRYVPLLLQLFTVSSTPARRVKVEEEPVGLVAVTPFPRVGPSRLLQFLTPTLLTRLAPMTRMSLLSMPLATKLYPPPQVLTMPVLPVEIHGLYRLLPAHTSD